MRFVTFVTALCLTLASSSHAQVRDHLQCFKVRDPLKLSATLDLDSTLGLSPNCIASTTKLYCVPSSKAIVGTPIDRATGLNLPTLPVDGPPAGARICYKLKCSGMTLPDQAVTDQFQARTVTRPKASLVCTPAFAGASRFVDGPGGLTVIDNYTGLEWEKKTNADGVPVPGDLHDADNDYTWWTGTGATRRDGTAFTDFIALLNTCGSPDSTVESTNSGFAEHCDWRLPTVQELKAITIPSCVTPPCIDPAFGPTSQGSHWSVSTAPGGANAWRVPFNGSAAAAEISVQPLLVRAVRGPHN